MADTCLIETTPIVIMQFGTIPPNKKIRVVYTLAAQSDGTTVVVITAFED